MTLDEAEKLARMCIELDGHEEPGQGRVSTDLARALLAVMPVVKAAIAWSESFGELSKRLPPHVHDLRRAVDELERQLSAASRELEGE